LFSYIAIHNNKSAYEPRFYIAIILDVGFIIILFTFTSQCNYFLLSFSFIYYFTCITITILHAGFKKNTGAVLFKTDSYFWPVAKMQHYTINIPAILQFMISDISFSRVSDNLNSGFL